MTTATAIAAGPAGPAGLPGQARALLALGAPLIGSNIAGFAIHATDVALMGWYDVTALAAITVAASLYFVVMLVAGGFANAVLPLVATAAQAGDAPGVRRVTRMALWLSVGSALLALPLLLNAEAAFLALRQDPEVARLAGEYLTIAGWGLVPTLMTNVLRSFLAALERTAVLLWITIGAALLNGVLGWALIFGRLGAPELGMTGAAVAALVASTIPALVLWAYALGRLPQYALLRRIWRLDRAAMGRVFRLGWPISLTMLAEVGLFAGSAVMVGWVGVAPQAAHGAAMQITSALFMVHLGLSQAATVRTGQALGRRDRAGLRQGAVAAMALGAAAALATSAAFLLIPEPLISLYVDPADPARPEVIRVGAMLLAFAALFQLMDAAQVLALGLLRGMHDTRVPMVMAVVSYWLVGAPASCALGFWAGLGAAGVWLGLTLGLAAASSLLMWRFWRRTLPAFAPA